jgi:hypothetical protein
MEHFAKNKRIGSILEEFLKSKALMGFVVFIFAVKIFFAVAQINFPYNIFFADITRSQLVQMLNQTRKSLGLNALTENEKLNQAATLKANDMVANGYFNHISPNGVTPWHWFSQTGYSYKYAGENLAIGFYDSAEVYNAWLNSPSHKENMVSPYYSEVGTAIVNGFGSSNAIVVVQMFGTQKSTTTDANNTKPTTQPQSQTQTQEPVQEPLQIQETQVGNISQTEPETIAETSNEVQRVLSSSDTIKPDNSTALSNLYSKLANFALYNFQSLIQYFIYTIICIVSLAFIYLLTLNLDAEIINGVATRAIILIIILISSAAINPSFITWIFPHQVII